jgi:exosortase K
MFTKALKNVNSGIFRHEASKWTILVTAGIIVFIMKYLHARAATEDLLFVLFPTSTAVAIFQNTPYHFVGGKGFVFNDLAIVIDKSCAGGNFLMLCVSVLTLAAVMHLKKEKLTWLVLPACLAIAWILAIITNVIRINTAIILLKFDNRWPWVASHWFHEMQGSIIYLSFLIIVFYASSFLIKKITQPS